MPRETAQLSEKKENILRMASKRRHLTDDQRAMLADEEREWLAEKNMTERAKKGRAAGGKATPDQTKDRLENTPISKRSEEPAKAQTTTRARDSAAKAHNVSPRKVQQAQAVKNASPELAEKVKNGEVRLAQLAHRRLLFFRSPTLRRSPGTRNHAAGAASGESAAARSCSRDRRIIAVSLPLRAGCHDNLPVRLLRFSAVF
jgi:hypothetical protein